ncbi:helix-turn-helix domain-containing protein [Streptomyces sp. NPDC001401]|uniref:helix-turn-helix domain-containing protein n=1 Tax=Streptomyces sp. NPDC001401 TaxID=3364570 RepID=UPI0036C458A4
MTATTSHSDTASPYEPHGTETTTTGPVDSEEANRSSSTPSRSSDSAAEYAERIRSELAARLLQLRTDRGWSVYDVERSSGVSRSTLSRVERNVTEPTISAVVQACHAYGYPASRLLAEAEASALSAASTVPPTSNNQAPLMGS